jgi:hypothetical protein
MKEARKKKRRLADAATTALMLACDPYGWFCVFVVFAKSRKAGLIFLAIILAVIFGAGIIAVVISWRDIKRYTQAHNDRGNDLARTD